MHKEIRRKCNARVQRKRVLSSAMLGFWGQIRRRRRFLGASISRMFWECSDPLAGLFHGCWQGVRACGRTGQTAADVDGRSRRSWARHPIPPSYWTPAVHPPAVHPPGGVRGLCERLDRRRGIALSYTMPATVAGRPGDVLATRGQIRRRRRFWGHWSPGCSGNARTLWQASLPRLLAGCKILGKIGR